MNMRINQEAEIATIKERNIALSLSDADFRRLWEIAEKAGMTAGGLLASFVGDLVGGTYTNGSDERMYAQSWYERCGFSCTAPKTFLLYLLKTGDIDGFVEAYREMEGMRLELAECGDQEEKDYIEFLENEIEELQSGTKEIFSSFLTWCGDEAHGNYDDEIKKVLTWYYNIKAASGGSGALGAPEDCGRLADDGDLPLF